MCCPCRPPLNGGRSTRHQTSHRTGEPKRMKQALQKAVDRLPEVLVQYAPTMMRRVIASMREQITKDGQTENASYCALLLKADTVLVAGGAGAGFSELASAELLALTGGTERQPGLSAPPGFNAITARIVHRLATW